MCEQLARGCYLAESPAKSWTSNFVIVGPINQSLNQSFIEWDLCNSEVFDILLLLLHTKAQLDL